MSSAGHIFDMIARMKNNRMKHDERRNRQKKVMESFSGNGQIYDHLKYRDTHEPANEQVIGQIHKRMQKKNRINLLFQFSLLLIVAIIAVFVSVKLIF